MKRSDIKKLELIAAKARRDVIEAKAVFINEHATFQRGDKVICTKDSRTYKRCVIRNVEITAVGFQYHVEQLLKGRDFGKQLHLWDGCSITSDDGRSVHITAHNLEMVDVEKLG